VSTIAAQRGGFYRTEASEWLPGELRRFMPDILWLPEPPAGDSAGTVALAATPIEGGCGAAKPLVSRDPSGNWSVHFPIAAAIEGILLERYHGGLLPTIEMKLPFNYSRFPNWIKSVARWMLSSRSAALPSLLFPPESPLYVVEWLRILARITAQPADSLGPTHGWPSGKRAAAVITHDVDTDWVFRNPKWLETICDLEERHGFFGAWYCVPWYSRSTAAERGMCRLQERKCEIGAHGFNHDARFPFVEEREFLRRMDALRQFAAQWNIKGFRSEWLYRTPRFLAALAGDFVYDSSVPSSLAMLTAKTANGCGSCLPYLTHGGLLELPLSLPMDEARHGMGLSPDEFWRKQCAAVQRVVELGGLAVVSVHPQSHQFANQESIRAIEPLLRSISADSSIWIARPDEIADWSLQAPPASHSSGKPI
jgi:peptidoglycan/xylan/chitin deacetylase (PgdA/CDA1 family)